MVAIQALIEFAKINIERPATDFQVQIHSVPPAGAGQPIDLGQMTVNNENYNTRQQTLVSYLAMACSSYFLVVNKGQGCMTLWTVIVLDHRVQSIKIGYFFLLSLFVPACHAVIREWNCIGSVENLSQDQQNMSKSQN